MKTLFAALCGLMALLTFSVAAHADTPQFYLHNGDKVVMYGDSITDLRMYTLYTEEFVTTRFPKLNIDWTNAGWAGDTVVGGAGGTAAARIQNDVLPYNPTVVTIMLGMNDGHYQPLTQKAYDIYTIGYSNIVDAIKKGAPGARLTLIQPSPYDEITEPPLFQGGYNSVLKTFGGYVKNYALQNGLTTSDFNTPVVALLQRTNSLDPFLARLLIPDRVHPSAGAQLMMTEALLKSWNAPRVVSTVYIDKTSKRVSFSENTTTANLIVTDMIIWDQIDNSLPMPVDVTDGTASFALNNSDFVNTLDTQILRVTALPMGNYALKIDNQSIATFTSAQLSVGVNLATMETPMLAQARQVAVLAKYHSDIQRLRWRSVQVPLATEPDPNVKAATQEMVAALNTREAAIVNNMRQTAQPVSHRFTLTPTP